MIKETNFDISVPRKMALYLLKPDSNGKSVSEINNICIMCKEYGDDDDWVGLYSDDYELILRNRDYKTFEVWLDEHQRKDEISRLIERLKTEIIMNEQEIIEEVQRSLSMIIEDKEIRQLMVALVREGKSPEEIANHVRELVVKYVIKKNRNE